MAQEWTIPSAAQASGASYVVTRGFQAVRSTLLSGTGQGIFHYGLMRVFQRFGCIEQGSANFRTSLCFWVISSAIEESGRLFLEATLAIVGERKQFENLQFNDQTPTSHKLRQYSWKVVFVLESVSHQVDRLFSFVLGIRTTRAIRVERVPVRDLHFIEIVRQAVLAEIVETSLTFLTMQLAFRTTESLGYNVKAFRAFIDGERKLSFVFGLLGKVNELYKARSADQDEFEFNQLDTAGNAALSQIRRENKIQNYGFENLLYDFCHGDEQAGISILQAVVTAYGTGCMVSEAIPQFLSPALTSEIRKLRNPDLGSPLPITEISVRNNTVFLETCVKEVMRLEAFAKVYVEDATTGLSLNPLAADIPHLLAARSKPALIYLLAHQLKFSSGLTNIISAEDRTAICAEFPSINKSLSATTMNYLAQYARTGVVNEIVRDYINILESALATPELAAFIRCVEATFPKTGGSLSGLD